MASSEPNPVDEVMAQLQAEANAIADTASAAAPGDVQAIDAATTTAAEIAGTIDSTVTTSPATAETDPPPPSSSPPQEDSDVHRLLAIEVPVIVQLGGRRMTVGEVMRFAVGSIVEISKAADDELELLANNKPIGKGHAVKVGENFGVKITSIGSVKEVIRQLGGKA